VMPTLLVTRPRAQAGELVALLDARGLGSVPVPTVEVDETGSTAALHEMLASLDGASWLVLTSANGARAVAGRLHVLRRGIPDGTRVAAVGPATAGALRSAGVAVDHVPRTYLTVAIADGLGDVGGQRVVLARADAASEDLGEVLRERGAIVDEVVAYRTIEGPSAGRDPLRAALNGELDGLTFTSSSTVRGLVRMASLIDRARARALPAFCIGPVTAAAARRAGFAVAAVAAEHTAAGLAAAAADHFGELR
jgi:uroporphyrinogen III methyltransferase / synthase